MLGLALVGHVVSDPTGLLLLRLFRQLFLMYLCGNLDRPHHLHVALSADLLYFQQLLLQILHGG